MAVSYPEGLAEKNEGHYPTQQVFSGEQAIFSWKMLPSRTVAVNTWFQRFKEETGYLLRANDCR